MKTTISLFSLLIFSTAPLMAQEETSADAAEMATEQEVDPDSSADMLNSQQQLQQTFTLKRTINGEVVETTKETVTLTSDVPYRPTEAGDTAMQQVEAAFDDKVLTRFEAFEEAKLDFTVADSDRDERMTSKEFVALVESWGETRAREPEFETSDDAQELSYAQPDGFIEGMTLSATDRAAAKAKFSFISGAAPSISREDYIREYLLDFDTMDKNDDTRLEGSELIHFRSANRGKNLGL